MAAPNGFLRARGLAAAALGTLDAWTGLAAECLAAFLVVVEIFILLAGVIFRYVIDHPLVWTDELAEILFLWLVSLGAVIALRRGEHMRMTFVVGKLPAGAQSFLQRIAALVVLIFIGVIIVPGIPFMVQQQAITTPTLQIPGSWEIAGELVVFVMLFIAATNQFFTGASLRELAGAVAVGLIIGGGFYFLEGWLQDIGNGALIVFFVGMVAVAIFCGVPIAFSFGIATAGYMYFTSTPTNLLPLSTVISQMDQGMSAIELLAVPMFIVLGLLLEMTGVARALINVLNALVGHKRGGLSYSLIGAMYLISGISGSKAADQAAIAPVLLPEMKRRGAHPGELVAQLASSAAMSETIPPSLVLIIVAAVTGISTQALFTGGLIPAGVAALALVALIFVRSRRDVPVGEPTPWKQTGRLAVVAIPALILPVLIRYAVLDGITTATEVATVGVAYTILVGLFIYRQFDWRRIYPMLVDTASLSGAILLIVGGATAMAWALTQSGFSHALAAFMGALPGGRWSFMAISIVVFAVLGSVLEGIPAMVLFGPLLFPIAKQLGVNDLHYAVVVILAMGIGLFAPPFGLGYYAACIIGRVPPEVGLRRIWPYLGALSVGIVIIALVPWLSTGFVSTP